MGRQAVVATVSTGLPRGAAMLASTHAQGRHGQPCRAHNATMDTPTTPPPLVVNQADVPEDLQFEGDHWGSASKALTPALDALGRQEKGLRPRLGMNLSRVPPGRSGCPFHAHAREDEVFYVLSGRGLFRHGDEVLEIGPGDCISCPAGTGIAHQIANPFDEDLVFLGAGLNDGHEVCTYPDSGKVMVRSLRRIGLFEATDYGHGEGSRPKLLDMQPTRARVASA
jgi:uncharacterized cupin superfamily protein